MLQSCPWLGNVGSEVALKKYLTRWESRTYLYHFCHAKALLLSFQAAQLSEAEHGMMTVACVPAGVNAVRGSSKS